MLERMRGPRAVLAINLFGAEAAILELTIRSLMRDNRLISQIARTTRHLLAFAAEIAASITRRSESRNTFSLPLRRNVRSRYARRLAWRWLSGRGIPIGVAIRLVSRP